MGNKYKPNKNLNNMKNFFFIALIALELCGCQNNQSSNMGQTSSSQELSAQKQLQKGQETWSYIDNKDDLSGKVVVVSAILLSNNVLEYEPGKTTRIGIGISYGSDTGKLQNSVFIGFHSDEYHMCRISEVKGSGFLATFDDGPIDYTWSLIYLLDNRKGVIIHELDQVADFISKIKKSKKCRIQVNTEQAGRKTFEFNTEGLEWDY